MRFLKRFTLRFNDENFWKKTKRIAEKEYRSMNDLTMRALRFYFESKQKR